MYRFLNDYRNKLRELRKLFPPFFQNATVFKNSCLLTYNLHWKRGLDWSIHIHSLTSCYHRWLFFSSFAPYSTDAIYSIVTNIFFQITQSLSLPLILKFTAPFLSNPIFSGRREAVALGRGKREAKSLYFHSRTLVPANPSISELLGKEKEKIKGRRKKKWGRSPL